MNNLTATIEGIGFWTRGLPSWDAARAYVTDGTVPVDAPVKPSPQVLAPNERRRAPESVAVALDVALSACTAAGRDPATLPSVFASMHGDLSITDYICSTLVADPLAVSPTRFHNSVHNAAAGYWTIGNGCTAPTTAISSFDASFAQGLVEALVQLAAGSGAAGSQTAGSQAILLVGYDSYSAGPLAAVSRSSGVLGGALVLSRDGAGVPGTAPRLRATLVDGPCPEQRGTEPSNALVKYVGGNAMVPMLPLFQALASGGDIAWLHAGPSRALRIELA